MIQLFIVIMIFLLQSCIILKSWMLIQSTLSIWRQNALTWNQRNRRTNYVRPFYVRGWAFVDLGIYRALKQIPSRNQGATLSALQLFIFISGCLNFTKWMDEWIKNIVIRQRRTFLLLNVIKRLICISHQQLH